MPRADVAVEVRHLTKRFGTVCAVDDLTFSVQRGRITGFLGPNGAGKTTTLRVLLGLVRPSSGEATFAGRGFRELAGSGVRVGAVLESSSVNPDRRLVDHLSIRAVAAGIPRERVVVVLDQVGLTRLAIRRGGTLSLGERQRLSLAAALLGDPNVVILDEPGNGLDPDGVRWLRLLLRGLADSGCTVLVSSHLLSEIALIADDVIVLDHGRLVTHSPLQELMAASGETVGVRTSMPRPLQEVLSREGATVRSMDGDRLEIQGSSRARVATVAASEGIPIFEIETRTATLEELFLRLTSAEGATR